MSTDMQKPVLATVVALEIESAHTELAEAALKDLLLRLRTLSSHSSSVQLQARNGAANAISVVLPPEIKVGSALRRCQAAAQECERQFTGIRIKTLVHHGVVFAGQQGAQLSYVGSAIRLAHSSLRRFEASHALVASADFVAHAREWANSPLSFTPLAGVAASEGLQAITIQDTETDSPSGLSSNNPELLAFLNDRLAADVGPFARVLVESARLVAGSVSALISELAHEVEEAGARERFIADCQSWVKAQEKD